MSGAPADSKAAKSNTREGGNMAEAKNPSIKENKTDPLGGAGNTGGGRTDDQGRTTFVEMFSCPCWQCAVLIIPPSCGGVGENILTSS